MKDIFEILKENRVLLSDGAWGTMLYNMGLKSTDCPEMWNITKPDRVLQVAKSYIDAGADIIETNSFGGSRLKLDMYGLAGKTREINIAAARISREAAADKAFVFGSVGPTGRIMMMGDVTEEEVLNAFIEQSVALEEGGADAIIIETMSAIDEALLAVKAAKENTSLPIICTFSFDKTVNGDYRTMMGVSPTDMLVALADSGVDVFGTNCGNGFDGIIEIVKEIRKTDPSVMLMVQANAGMPQLIDGENHFKEGPGEMAAKIPQLIGLGVNIIGGCCGTTPDHIKQFAGVIALSNERR